MVVYDLDVERVTLVPTEADAPLLVDPNAVLSCAVTPQGLQPIPWRDPQLGQIHGRVQHP